VGRWIRWVHCCKPACLKVATNDCRRKLLFDKSRWEIVRARRPHCRLEKPFDHGQTERKK
jgi:hypothetical protein